MAAKPTYQELEKRVEELEVKVAGYQKARKKLLENKERFRLLYERAPLAYQSLDEQGCLLEVNKAWLDMMGFERHEVIGRSMADFLNPKWQDHFQQNFPRFKAMGEVLGIEFELCTKDGQPVLISVNGRIGYDENGNFLQTHCILYDITERDRADRIRDQVIAEMQEQLSVLTRKIGVMEACKTCREKLENNAEG